MSEPMTLEELAEIRDMPTSEPFIVRQLLDEIDRLRAQVAAFEKSEKRERERAEIFGR